MVVFEDISDVNEWLAPLGFDAFWEAIALWNLYTCADRAHFKQVLADGVTTEETMLTCLKAEVRLILTERFSLTERYIAPTDAAFLHRIH